jgi:hypothetical protein
VHDVVQDRHLEDAEQLGIGVVTGERHVAEVRGHARDEPEDAHEKEHRPDDPGRRDERVRSPRRICGSGHGEDIYFP